MLTANDLLKKYSSTPEAPEEQEAAKPVLAEPAVSAPASEEPVESPDTLTASSLLTKFGTGPQVASKSSLPVATASETKDSSFLEEVRLGAKESLLPFQVTEQEAKREGTLTRGITNIAVDIAGLLAAGKTGAIVGGAVAGPVGAVVGATGATVGLGVYRALGLENVRATADDRVVDPKNIAVNLVTETLPIVRHAKTGMNIALSLGQAGAQYAQAKQYGASGEMAALLAVVGGGVSAATRQKVSKTEIEDLGVLAFVTSPSMPKKAVEGIEQVLSEGKESRVAQQVYEHLDKYRDSENVLAKIVSTTPEKQRDVQKLIDGLDDVQRKSLLSNPEVEIAKEAFNELSPKVKANISRVFKSPEDYAIASVLRDHQQGLANYITGKTGKTALKEFRETLDKQALTDTEAYNLYKVHKLATEKLKQKFADVDEIPDLGKIMGWTASDYHVARYLDDVTGLDFRSRLDQLSQSELSHRSVVLSYAKDIDKLEKTLQKAKVSSEDIGRLMELDPQNQAAMISKLYPKNSKDVVDAISETRKIFDQAKQFGLDNGIKIGTLENYFTSISQDTMFASRSLNTVRKELDTVLKQDKTLREVTDLNELISRLGSKPETDYLATRVGQLRTALTRALDLGEDAQVKVSDIPKLIKKFENLSIKKTSIGYEASAAFTRKGEIPELIRERDVGTVLRSYVRNISRAVHFDSQLKNLGEYRDSLQALGFKNAARWMDDYIEKQSGHPGRVMSAIAASKQKLMLALEESADAESIGKRIGAKAALAGLDALTFIPNVIYQNFLGARLGPIILNMTQPFMFGGTEVGGMVGQRMAASASMKTAMALASKKSLQKEVTEYLAKAKAVPELQDRFKNVQLAPASFGPLEEIALMTPLKEQMRKGKTQVAAEKFTQTMGQISLAAYSYTDVLNRHITINMGKDLTKNLLKNKSFATQFLREADTSLKSDIGRLISLREKTTNAARKSQIDQTIEYTVVGYLMGKTQFYYTKASSQRFMREAGPLISMFTKFPIMVGSDMAEQLRKREYSKFMKQYLAPTAAVMGFYQLLGDYKDEPRAQVLRLNNAWKMTKLSALEVGPPPVLTTAGSAVQSLADVVNGDFERIGGRVASQASTVLPGMWAIQSYKDLYKLIENRKPEL